MSGAVDTSAAKLIEGPAVEPKPSAARRFFSAWLVRRLLKALLTVFIVTTGTFFLVRLLPGNPVETYIQTQIAQTGISYEAAAAQAVVIAANAVDSSGYPDCRPEYYRAFQEVARLGTKRGVEGDAIEVRTPLSSDGTSRE